MRKSNHRRLNITLPESTIAMLDRVAGKGTRSSLIDDAIKDYVRRIKRDDLAEQLKKGALLNADRDLGIAEEWSDAEIESWLS